VQRVGFGDSDTESVLRGTSAILSGFLVRSELGSEKLALRRAEQFRVRSASWSAPEPGGVPSLLGRSKVAGGLRLRKVSLSKQGIELELNGQATAVAYGPYGFERDAMPAELEWIAANQRIKLIWASVVFGFGLVVGFGRWFTTKS
jgi:hypothetical protein